MLKWLSLCVVLLLAACGSGEAQPTGVGGSLLTPTVPAPEWREPAEPITITNVSQITTLGRLDSPGTPSTLFAFDFSPDGTRLAALNNELLLTWNLITGELVFSTARQDATKVFYSPDKTEIYTVGQGGVAQVYDANDGKILNSFNAHANYDTVAAFSDPGGWLALGGIDGVVKVWDAYERLSLVTIQAHAVRVNELAFSQDGELLATGGDDGVVRVWRWRDRQQIAAFDHNGLAATRIVFSPDGAQLAVGTVRYTGLWSIPDNQQQYTLQTGAGGATDVLAYSPDGRYLVTGGSSPDMRLWNPHTGALIATLPEMGGDRTSAAFSPGSDMLLASVLDGQVTLWDISRLEDETIKRAELQIQSNRVLYVNWTDDGFLMSFLDATGPVYLWGIAGS